MYQRPRLSLAQVIAINEKLQNVHQVGEELTSMDSEAIARIDRQAFVTLMYGALLVSLLSCLTLAGIVAVMLVHIRRREARRGQARAMAQTNNGGVTMDSRTESRKIPVSTNPLA